MAKITPGHHCCPYEKKELVENLRTCDYCTTSLQERHDCYRQVAKQSKKRVRACMYS